MKKAFSVPVSLVVLAGLFFALVLLNNQLLSSTRLDLTENQVYSLSDGSKAILKSIDEPVNLYYFFSDTTSKGMTQLRNYATRVESLLEEYESASNGKVKLHIIDPKPFSEDEDKATEFGLTAAAIGPIGEAIYMGLAGTNSLDDQQVIGFFDPAQESFLEYELSKLIYQLSDPEPVKVTMLTDLGITGGQNPMTGRMDPQWAFYGQLEQLYDVELISGTEAAVPENTDVLILVHPQNLSDSLLYSIDQFVMSGGNLMAFVDPHHESDQMAMMGGMGANSSDLGDLFASWGIAYDAENIVLDAQAGLEIRTANGVTRHLGFLGLGVDEIDRDDVVTAGMDVINGASFGSLGKTQTSGLSMLPLLKSTASSGLYPVSDYALSREPESFSREFSADAETYVLAARYTGRVQSAYETAPEEADATQFVGSATNANVIVIADTDLLADRFWVQQTSFFGQTIFTPFANNGDIVSNGVENLGGSNALISIRSRGTFARPFTRVQELEVVAEQKFREQELILQQQLDDTEMQLTQLQNQQGEGTSLVVTPEQQAAIDEFVQKRIEIRKELRDVRYQLDKDIDTLGNWLKFINIAVAPIALVVVLMLLASILRRRGKIQGASKA